MTLTIFNNSEKSHIIENYFENIWKIGNLEIFEFLNFKIFPKFILIECDANKKISNNFEIIYSMKQSFKILKKIIDLDMF